MKGSPVRVRASALKDLQNGYLCFLIRRRMKCSDPDRSSVSGHFAWFRLPRGAGAEEVRAALARELAAAFTEAPAYARAKLAAKLRALVAEVEASEMEEPNAPRLLRQVDAG
jgi:hypothetical protein